MSDAKEVKDAENGNPADARERIFKLVEEGKISAKDATGMLAVAGGRYPGRHGILFGFIPMLFGFILGGGLLFTIFIYLPLHVDFKVLGIVYGFLAVVALAFALVAVAAIGIGRIAVKRSMMPHIKGRDGEIRFGPPADAPGEAAAADKEAQA